MTPGDAARLLAAAAAFDNRDTGEAAARAWAAALRDMPCDPDAFAAVAQFYGQPDPAGTPPRRRWIEPHHIATIRQQIRDRRIGDATIAYDGRDDETGSEFVRRRRAQLAAIGDGRAEPVPVAQLTGGPAPSVAARLGNIGQLPDAHEGAAAVRAAAGMTPRHPALAAACPVCGAPAGQPCHTRGARQTPMRQPHPGRIDTATA